tara:strand:- start:557 stop:772 length:216 start_codon:yes stop_codon:yes gene_type:complete
MSEKILVSNDKKSVYLEVSDTSECCFELWEVSDGTKISTVRIKIPIKSWEKVVKDWHNKIDTPIGEENDTL